MRNELIMKVFRRLAVVSGLAALAACAFAAPSEAASSSPTELTAAEGDGYSIQASDVSTSAGGEGNIVVTVKAKPGYHVNREYPHKVKVQDPPEGVELPKTEVEKGDGTFKDDNTFEVKLPVKAIKAGTYEISLKVKTSVCNDSQCLIKKEVVTAKVVAR
jgi:cytochrome c biogenesis DsbD-like protein